MTAQKPAGSNIGISWAEASANIAAAQAALRRPPIEEPTVTLPEFLLARIGEDEAETWTLVPYECPPGCCAPAGWVGSQCRYCDVVVIYGGTVEAMTSSAEEHAERIHQRSRTLAECEAKRRIVDEHRGGEWPNPPDPCDAHDASFESVPCDTLRHLAAVYADHPDYDEAWRP